MATVGAVMLATWALLLWIYYLWTRRRYYKIAWQLPGPIGLPFIGLGLQMMNPETFLQYMETLSKKYKTPFISWMGTNCFLYVNDPETVETIFNSPHCTNKGEFYRFLVSAIGDGLFTSSSPRWNKHRRLINPAFSRQIINNFLTIFNAEADVLLEKFATDGRATAAQSTTTSVKHKNEEKFEIYEMIKKSVLEIACQTTMGKRMNFQSDGSASIFDAYNGITEVCVKRMLSPWLYPDVIYRRSSLFMLQQKVVNVLFGFVENLLQYGKKSNDMAATQRQQQQQPASSKDEIAADSVHVNVNTVAGSDGDGDGVDGISKSKAIFVEQVRNYVDQGQLSWNDVRDEANVIIAATFETTSTALYIVCLCLAMHPECQDKLYNELITLFPDNNDTDVNDFDERAKDKSTTRRPHRSPLNIQVTNAHLERMKYTEMVINEAMRLFAPVPIVLRSASDDVCLRNGAVIPRGTQIGIDIYNMQRSAKVWGDKSRQFCPELHFGPSAATQHPFAFIPFTKGLRMCIGYRYALMLMKVTLAKLFRNFRLHTDAKIDDLIIKGTISLKLREYPLCTVVKR